MRCALLYFLSSSCSGTLFFSPLLPCVCFSVSFSKCWQIDKKEEETTTPSVKRRRRTGGVSYFSTCYCRKKSHDDLGLALLNNWRMVFYCCNHFFWWRREESGWPLAITITTIQKRNAQFNDDNKRPSQWWPPTNNELRIRKIGPMSRTTSDDLCVIRDVTQPNAPAIVFLSFK
jgi:hypothetical protein